MIYKRTFLEKLFRVKKTCYAENCNHIFKDGDDYQIEDLLFGDVKVCTVCYDVFTRKIEEDKEERKKQKLDKKRADYKILAEEIVKLMKL